MTGNQQLRNILKSINFGELTAAQVNQVGSGVFADINAKSDMKNLNEITNAWRAVTNPSYGQFIPQSGEFFRVTVADSANSIISPTGNEVYRLIGISISNQTLGSLISWSGPVGWIYRGGRIVKSRLDAGEMLFPSLGF